MGGKREVCVDSVKGIKEKGAGEAEFSSLTSEEKQKRVNCVKSQEGGVGS